MLFQKLHMVMTGREKALMLVTDSRNATRATNWGCNALHHYLRQLQEIEVAEREVANPSPSHRLVEGSRRSGCGLRRLRDCAASLSIRTRFGRRAKHSEPSLRITRWQGIGTARLFAAQAPATARTRSGSRGADTAGGLGTGNGLPGRDFPDPPTTKSEPLHFTPAVRPLISEDWFDSIEEASAAACAGS